MNHVGKSHVYIRFTCESYCCLTQIIVWNIWDWCFFFFYQNKVSWNETPLQVRYVYGVIVFRQVKGRSVCSSSCMRCCRRRTWAAASGGFSRRTGRSSSRPRTKRSWPRCGASARATAKPWPTRRWRAPCATTRAPERSVKWNANSRTSLTRARSGGFKTMHRNSLRPKCNNNRIKMKSLWSGKSPEWILSIWSEFDTRRNFAQLSVLIKKLPFDGMDFFILEM